MSDSFKTLLSNIQNPDMENVHGGDDHELNNAIQRVFVIDSKCITLLDTCYKKMVKWNDNWRKAEDALNAHMPRQTPSMSRQYVDQEGNAEMKHPDEQPEADGSGFVDSVDDTLTASQYRCKASAAYWKEQYELAQAAHEELGTDEENGVVGVLGYAKDAPHDPNYISRAVRYGNKTQTPVVTPEVVKPTAAQLKKRNKKHEARLARIAARRAA